MLRYVARNLKTALDSVFVMRRATLVFEFYNWLLKEASRTLLHTISYVTLGVMDLEDDDEDDEDDDEEDVEHKGGPPLILPNLVYDSVDCREYDG